MKTILMMVLLVGCGDDTNGIGPDGSMPDGGVDGTSDGSNDMRDPDAMPPDVTSIPGGTFHRAYDAVNYTDGTHFATMSGFGLDTYEVTVARFRAFVVAGKGVQGGPPAAGAGAHANIAGSGWDSSWNALLADSTATLVANLKCSTQYQTWTDAAGGNEQKPINCVTWYEAAAFCAWDGGYLPTEAQYNYAQAGANEQRVYPWSSPATSTTIDGTYANYATSTLAIKAVGALPAGNGRWGHADLVGNVAEWTLDLFNDAATYIDPCNDCANLSTGTSRIYRGGNFGSPAGLLGVGVRAARPPTDRNPGVGFRCARAQ